MAEILLQATRVVALVGEHKPAGMPQHVGMGREAEPSSLTGAFNKSRKARCGEGRAALTGEYERRLRLLLALQLA